VLVRLSQLPPRHISRIAAIAWTDLSPREAKRLRELGFDEGVQIEALHRGALQGPMACRVGRMIVALRHRVATAVSVEAA
jgi:ferrous iron transport protein A